MRSFTASILLGLLLLSGCSAATSGRVEPLTVTVPVGDREAFIENRNAFVSRMQEPSEAQVPKGEEASKQFSRLTLAGVGIGLFGGLFGLVSTNDDTISRVAQGGSLIAGAISGWIGFKNYEKTATTGEKCDTFTRSARNAFSTRWEDDDFPETPAEADAFEKDKDDMMTQVNAICFP